MPKRNKFVAKIINRTENFSNFRGRNHSGIFSYKIENHNFNLLNFSLFLLFKTHFFTSNSRYNKECEADPLYEKLVKAYDEAAPSADTKYFLATILIKKGKFNEAKKYLEASYNLEKDSFKKSKRAYGIGLLLKKQNKYYEARNYFRKALKLNPSNGKPHLAIAAMYEVSAKNCGDTNFNKRAVYWLAAKETEKCVRIDPILRKKASQLVKRYNALAPSKEEIFKCACSGKVIKIGCWINDSVTVPSI